MVRSRACVYAKRSTYYESISKSVVCNHLNVTHARHDEAAASFRGSSIHLQPSTCPERRRCLKNPLPRKVSQGNLRRLSSAARRSPRCLRYLSRHQGAHPAFLPARAVMPCPLFHLFPRKGSMFCSGSTVVLFGKACNAIMPEALCSQLVTSCPGVRFCHPVLPRTKMRRLVTSRPPTPVIVPHLVPKRGTLTLAPAVTMFRGDPSAQR